MIKNIYIQYSEFTAHSVFQGEHKLLKNPECKNYIQCSENFQGKRKLFKILKGKKYIQYSEFRAHLVFQGKQKFLKHPECKNYIKYSEKFNDNLCFQGKILKDKNISKQ